VRSLALARSPSELPQNGSYLAATEERLRGHLSCSQPRPEEEGNADSNRTAAYTMLVVSDIKQDA